MRYLSLLALVLLAVWFIYANDETEASRAGGPRSRRAIRETVGGAEKPLRAAAENTLVDTPEHVQRELDRLLELLQGEELREDDSLQERGAARKRIEELVTPTVAAAAIASMMLPGSDHKRAQLLLALAPNTAGLEVLLDAPDPLVRLYARLRLSGPIKPEQIQVFGLSRPGTGFEPLPIEAIYTHVLVLKKDRNWIERFEQDYEREFLPRLREIDKHIPAHRRIRADLDGDGKDELFLDGTHLWETVWRHSEGFIAIVGSNGELNWILKTEEQTKRVVVADANGDGTPGRRCHVPLLRPAPGDARSTLARLAQFTVVCNAAGERGTNAHGTNAHISCTSAGAAAGLEQGPRHSTSDVKH